MTHIADQSREVSCPVFLPLYRLRCLSLAVPDVKAKFPSWRDTLAMKLRDSSAELHWVRHARRHVDKVAEEEVGVDGCVSEFAPSNGPRRECRDQFVDFGD